MKNAVYTILMSFIAITLLMPALALSEQPKKFVICKNGKAVRTLRIEKDPSGQKNCVTTYTKNGKDEVVGEALNPNSCEDVLSRVQKTLETNAWKCKAYQSSYIYRETAAVSESSSH